MCYLDVKSTKLSTQLSKKGSINIILHEFESITFIIESMSLGVVFILIDALIFTFSIVTRSFGFMDRF